MPNATSPHVIIVGAGVMGAAAAYHLGKAGARVTLVEQFAINHGFGSSHGPSRVIRLNYEGLDYVALAKAAYRQWHAVEDECGEKLLHYTGGMDIGPAETLAAMRETLTKAGVAFDYIDSAEVMRRSPKLRMPDGLVALHQRDYGILKADRCVAQLAQLAQRAGAVVRENESVTGISATAHGVTVHTSRGALQADKLVLAAGSWMRPLVRPLGVDLPLTVVKETIAYYKPDDPAPYMPDRFPLFLQRFADSTVIGNAFPILGHEGVKVIFDRHGERVDPAPLDTTPGHSQLEKIRQYRRQVLPYLGENMIEAVACRYTMTPDEDFIIDRMPDHPNIVIGSPCSGHGFKFGIVIGQILSDLALQGKTTHNIHRFRLNRPALKAEAGWTYAADPGKSRH